LCRSGTDADSATAIVKDGFKIGGKDIPAAHGSSFGVGQCTGNGDTEIFSLTTALIAHH